MRRCVWSRNLKNEEAMARVGPQRHRGEKKTKTKEKIAQRVERENEELVSRETIEYTPC